LEATWRAVVGHLEGRGQSPQTLIQSGFIGNIALTWRVFGKSIYKEKQMRSENWEVRSEESNSNNNLHENQYTYDTAFFFNCKAVHMHTKYRGKS
jgi:hypothetical protein